MANIQWTSSSISSYFQTSLNQKSTGFNSLYNLLGDASLIKNGSYYKLMDAYYKNVKSQETTNTSEDTSEAKSDSSTTESDNVLDTLLTDTTLASAYSSDGTATTNQSTSSLFDTQI